MKTESKKTPGKSKKRIAIQSIFVILTIVVIFTLISIFSTRKDAQEPVFAPSSSRVWEEQGSMYDETKTTTNSERELPGLTVRGEPLK